MWYSICVKNSKQPQRNHNAKQGNVGVSFDVLFKLSEVLEVAPKDMFDFRS